MKRIVPDHDFLMRTCPPEHSPEGNRAPTSPQTAAPESPKANNISYRSFSPVTPTGVKTIEGTERVPEELERPERRVPSNILDENQALNTTLLSEILRLLGRLQDETTLKHRFHLFVESVERTSEEAEQGTNCSILTRLAFSPTLFASNDDQKSRLAYVCQKVTEFSFAKVSHVDSQTRSEATRSAITRSVQRSAQRPPTNNVERDRIVMRVEDVSAVWPLRVYEGLNFPSWCPFNATEYKTPPQASSERLFIRKSVLDLFLALEDFQVMWIYQELFKFLYRNGRKRRIPGMARTLTYSQFTPPWIRRCLTVGDENPDNENDENGEPLAESVALKKVAIMHLRNERNTQGYRRVRFLLAAFFCHEADTVKPLIQHLLQTVPSQRARVRRKPGRKRNICDNSPHDGENAMRNKRVDNGSAKRTHVSAQSTENGNQEQHTTVESSGLHHDSSPVNEASQHNVANNTSEAERGSGPSQRGASPNSSAEHTTFAHPNTAPFASTTHGRSKSTSNASRSAERSARTSTSLLNNGIPRNVRGNSENRRDTSKPRSVFENIRNPSLLQRNDKQSEANQIAGTELNLAQGRSQSSGEKHNSVPKTHSSVPETHISVPETHTFVPETPLTPFTPSDHSVAQTQESSDSEDVEDGDEATDPRNGVIKCGSLARCVYVLNFGMQESEHLDGHCKKCRYQMHRRCMVLHELCDECVKAKVFRSIHREELSGL